MFSAQSKLRLSDRSNSNQIVIFSSQLSISDA